KRATEQPRHDDRRRHGHERPARRRRRRRREQSATSGRKDRPDELRMKMRVDGSEDQIDDEAEAQTLLAKDGGDLLAISQPPAAGIESEKADRRHRIARRRLRARPAKTSAPANATANITRMSVVTKET